MWGGSHVYAHKLSNGIASNQAPRMKSGKKNLFTYIGFIALPYWREQGACARLFCFFRGYRKDYIHTVLNTKYVAASAHASNLP